MKFSLDWLREHVAIDLSPEDRAARLTAVGLAVEGIERVGDDVVLEVEITGNRPDCMNHRGLAREIAALSGKPLRPLDRAVRESDTPVTSLVSVRIENPAQCSRY